MTTQVDQNRGDEDGQLAHQATPKAQGREADNLYSGSGLDSIVNKWLNAAYARGQLSHDDTTSPMIIDLRIELKNDLKTCFKNLTLNTMQEGIDLKRPMDDWYWLSVASNMDKL